MPRTSQPPRAPQRLALLHEQGPAVRLLTLRAAPAAPLGFTVDQAQSFPTADAAALVAALTKARPEAVVAVIPAASTVARGVEFAAPSGTPSQIASALDLVAESQLGTTLDPHRRAAGFLPTAGGKPLTIVAGWTGEPGPVHATLLKLPALNMSVTWVPEPVALAALATATGAPLALSAERSTGAVLLVAAGAEKCVLRDLCEDGEDPEAWSQTLVERATAAATLAGLTPPGSAAALGTAAPAATRLFTAEGSPVRPTLGGAPTGTDAQAWLDHFGPALGAALAVTKRDPLSTPLLSLRPLAPIADRPAVLRVVDWFSKPSRGVAALLIALTLALTFPLGAAWARLQLLSDQSKDAGEDPATTRAAQQQAEFYKLLKDRRWPMTKLFSDLTGNIPQGITLESLRIEYDRKVEIGGTADSPQAAAEWRAALDKSRVFDEVRMPTNEASAFAMTARVAQPLIAMGAPDQPTQSALIVTPTPAAAAPPPPPPRNSPSPATAAGTATKSDPAGNNNTTATRRTPRSPAEKADPANDIPPPISDAEIAQLDKTSAMKEFASRKGAAGKATNPADKERLLEESRKAQEQFRKLSGSGGGGA
jgi:hypothetical protein